MIEVLFNITLSKQFNKRFFRHSSRRGASFRTHKEVRILKMQHYKIEDCIHFYPQQNMLYNVRTEDSVILLSAAAECLKLLIEKQGEIISRQTLTECVWGSRGVVISANTYYQTMLNLRRGFENVGMNACAIATHYGKGVNIDSSLTIVKVAEQEQHPPPKERSEISAEDRSEERNEVVRPPVFRRSINSELLLKYARTLRKVLFTLLLILNSLTLACTSYFFYRGDFLAHPKQVSFTFEQCEVHIYSHKYGAKANTLVQVQQPTPIH